MICKHSVQQEKEIAQAISKQQRIERTLFRYTRSAQVFWLLSYSLCRSRALFPSLANYCFNFWIPIGLFFFNDTNIEFIVFSFCVIVIGFYFIFSQSIWLPFLILKKLWMLLFWMQVALKNANKSSAALRVNSSFISRFTEWIASDRFPIKLQELQLKRKKILINKTKIRNKRELNH